MGLLCSDEYSNSAIILLSKTSLEYRGKVVYHNNVKGGLSEHGSRFVSDQIYDKELTESLKVLKR